MRYLSSLYLAVVVLVLTFVAGAYVTARSEDMHMQHLGISSRLERIVRLEQELAGLLSGAVLEEKLIRVSRYDSVNESLKETVSAVAALARELELSQDILALRDLQQGLRTTELRSLAHMRAGRWRQARAVLFEEDYLLAKKIHEITTESVITALSDELAQRDHQLKQLRRVTDAFRVAAVLLLLWVGAMFARRLRLELDQQRRLQHTIEQANVQLEVSVRERTAQLQEANAQLAALSMTDALTGLANRRRFDEVWAVEWQRAARSGQALALAIMDVDDFKAYNDHYGHQAGDDCLRHVAAILARETRRAGELVARYGGEEFVLVLPGLTGAQARDAVERLRAAVQAEALPHAHSRVETVVTVSIGVAAGHPLMAADAEALLKEADVALYLAKRQGRNRVQTAH